MTITNRFSADSVVVWPEPIESWMVTRLAEAVEGILSSAIHLPSQQQERLLYERDLPATRRNGIGAEAVGDAVFIISDPAYFDSVFTELLCCPCLVEAAQSLLGTADVAGHFLNVTIKHPRFGRAIGWHRDFPNTLYCTAASDFIRLMVCLDGMDHANGATCFVPGSHRIPDDTAIGEKARSKWPKPQSHQVQMVTCRPGQMVGIDAKVLHGGGMNTSARLRRNIVLQVGRAEAPLVTEASETITGIRLRGRP